jgi:hypothetical protein
VIDSDQISTKIFILSPANLRGVRGAQLDRSQFWMAASARSAAKGLSVEEAFTFTSRLYFRGKIAYARRFAVPPTACPRKGIYVIAPGFGLVAPDWTIDRGRFARLRRISVDAACDAFRKPLEAGARTVAKEIGGDTAVVLLGSLARGKYLDLLWSVFGDRLVAPEAFVGTGDMRRGALLLRAVDSGEELEYLACSGLIESMGRDLVSAPSITARTMG